MHTFSDYPTVTVPTCMYQVRNKQFSSVMLLQPTRKYIPLKPTVTVVVCILEKPLKNKITG